ncbi:TPA: acyltransferase [Photobacterium damselae]
MNTTILYLYNVINLFLPETKFFHFRNKILKLAGVNIGNNVRICGSTKFIGNGEITIKNNTWIGPGCFISSSRPACITIGENVDIAPYVKIITGSHLYGNSVRVAGKGINESISIGDGSWICTNSLILHGVVIGESVLVAANSTVIDNVKSASLIAGVKAKFIKDL